MPDACSLESRHHEHDGVLNRITFDKTTSCRKLMAERYFSRSSPPIIISPLGRGSLSRSTVTPMRG